VGEENQEWGWETIAAPGRAAEPASARASEPINKPHATAKQARANLFTQRGEVVPVIELLCRSMALHSSRLLHNVLFAITALKICLGQIRLTVENSRKTSLIAFCPFSYFFKTWRHTR
jgi:hypothetical protein